jgi:hypothetical protein
MDKVIAVIDLNSLEELHVGLSENRGRSQCYVRDFVKTAGGPAEATKNALSLSPRVFPELVGALQKCVSGLSRRP